MNKDKETLVSWIKHDETKLIHFLSRFVQVKSPNPPGDTRAAAKYIGQFLDSQSLTYRIIDPKPEFPNIVASFDGGRPGKHLILNGHIDVFPADGDAQWIYDRWSGAIADGKIWGRGAADMKCGTTCSIFTYAYLHRIRHKLKGRLSLTAVSDEETFGPWGADYLVKNHPETHGDCCLNGEPSSPLSIRFGEKGPLWLRFTISTAGAHGAYTHLTESASKIGARLIQDLDEIENIQCPTPDILKSSLDLNRDTLDKALGAGASKIVDKATVNIGVVRSGVKVNMVPSECVIDADIRLPINMTPERVLETVDKIMHNYPQASYQELNRNLPNWCDPNHEMVTFLQNNALQNGRPKPQPVCSLGGTDARLWRYINVPAFVYGPYPTGMGTINEYVDIEDFLHILHTHVLSAYDYLTA